MNDDWHSEWPDDSDEFSDLGEPFDDSEADLITCTECGGSFHDEAIRCPYCGNYATYDTSVWSGRSPWWIVLGLLGIFAVIVALAFGS